MGPFLPSGAGQAGATLQQPSVTALTTRPGLAGRGSGQSCSAAPKPFPTNPEMVLSSHSQLPLLGLLQPGRNILASACVRPFPLPSWKENQPDISDSTAQQGEHQES